MRQPRHDRDKDPKSRPSYKAQNGLVPLSREFNPGKAFWCTEHGPAGGGPLGRLECTKRSKSTDERCHMEAIRGTNSCHHHSGQPKELMHAMGEAVITAWSALGTVRGKQIDPGLAVLAMLQQSWLRAHAYGQLLRKQVVRDTGADPEDVENMSVEGLIGWRYAAAGQDGTVYQQSEEVRSLAALEERERDRVVRFAECAHDMGVSKRLVETAEKWGDVVAGRITAMLDGLELTMEQRERVPILVEAVLSDIDLSIEATPQ